MREIAILGASGSGKTELSLNLADKLNAIILSLDSLSIYQQINIASAKPSKEEIREIPHFGIDILTPKESHNAQVFIQEYQKAKAYAKNHQKNLLIVGGTSFYLKILLEGLSTFPKLTQEEKTAIRQKIHTFSTQQSRFIYLKSIDKTTKIHPNDTYRTNKALEIYFSTSLTPTQYFQKNPPIPLLKNCEIYEILLSKEELKQKITKRTHLMLQKGLIEEVTTLLNRFGDSYQWAKSIGIKEVRQFLKGEFSKEYLESLITTHTLQLAKRQKTFNKTQFKEHFCGSAHEVSEMLLSKNLS
ncbi:tRNA (adenosine(37)-N6)-dimethylallyltransferase MiaA [Helicobacter mesocricetorum]|uniref:tRNA (adenosine(37)-N6)-dimethylallyltransferase MiaA n=1 Tax=Helicobacter mesocricetorum TaxID=87012 RepID=UPI000CF12DB8|nr:tRNA (adenosine(37)-N6)-dimethylallyltransferase MiaA [Helicobacter mesocricetorum]